MTTRPIRLTTSLYTFAILLTATLSAQGNDGPVALKAERFPLNDVRLLDGPFKRGQDRAVEYLLTLEPDRLLADWFEGVHANLTDEQMQQTMVAEHGGINETLADLYADTDDVCSICPF